MDATTIDAYNRMGATYAERYRTHERVCRDWMVSGFEKEAVILDIGAGSGADMAFLQDLGWEVWGVEPSVTLIAETEKWFPGLVGRIYNEGMPLPEERLNEWKSRFGGIVCNAMLMHIDPELQQMVLSQLRGLLHPRGRLFLTVSEDRPGLDDECRDKDGRYYAPLDRARVMDLCESSGFRFMKEWENRDYAGRGTLLWHSYLFER